MEEELQVFLKCVPRWELLVSFILQLIFPGGRTSPLAQSLSLKHFFWSHKEIPRKVITLFIRGRYLFVFRARPIQSTSNFHRISLRCILMLYFHLRQKLSSFLFPSVYANKTYTHLYPPPHTCHMASPTVRITATRMSVCFEAELYFWMLFTDTSCYPD